MSFVEFLASHGRLISIISALTMALLVGLAFWVRMLLRDNRRR